MGKKTDKLGGKKRTTICINEARKISLKLKKCSHFLQAKNRFEKFYECNDME